MGYGAEKVADFARGHTKALILRVTTEMEPCINVVCVFVDGVRSKARTVIKSFIETFTNDIMDGIDN